MLEEIAIDHRPEPDDDAALVDEVATLAGSGWASAAIAREVGLSARQLQRRSAAAFGYGTKTLQRILRLQRALALVRTGARAADSAARVGYADQAHLARDVKDRVLDRIRTTRQEPPRTVVTPLRRKGSALALRLTSIAAAALFVVAVGLGVIVVRQNDELDQGRAQAAEMTQLLRAGDVRLVTADEGSSGRMVIAMSRSQNKMLVLTDGLSNPPAGHDFQVWTGHGEEMISAGFLNPVDGEAALEISDFGDAEPGGVTVEPDGGSPAPTTDPVMLIPLPV